MVRRAKYGDINLIQNFISENYSENHILSRVRALFVHEYLDGEYNLDPAAHINFYIYEEEGEITAILGFYNYKKVVCLSMWVAKVGGISGLKLFNYVAEIEKDKEVIIVGISKQAEKIYAALGYKIDRLEHYVSSNPDFVKDQKISIQQVNSVLNSSLYNQDEYKRRVLENPFVDYYIHQIDDTQFVYRIINKNLGLIVDVLGNTENLEDKISRMSIEVHLKEIHIYINKKLKLAKADEMSGCISEFGVNPQINYASKNNVSIPITKIWGDQDRLAKTNRNYALVNNFMYHYIRDDNSVQHKRGVAQFYSDVSVLEKKYKNITLNEIERDSYDMNAEYYMLSFDDYYKEHEEIVIPFLKSKGLSGFFFVPALKPEVNIMTVNIIQQLMYELGVEKLEKLIKNELNEIELKSNETFDTDEVYRLKRKLQSLDEKVVRELYGNCKNIDLYGSSPQTKVVDKMYLGNHLSSHRHLTHLTDEEIRDEIEFFEDKFQATNKIVAYPYGSYDERVTKVFKQHGYKYGWTVKRGYSIVSSEENLRLNRYDCNDIDAIKN